MDAIYPSSLLADGGASWPLWVGGLGTLVLAISAVLLYRRYRWPVVARLAKHPFAKYVVFSVVAHLALAAWILTTKVFDVPTPGKNKSGAVTVQLDSGDGSQNDLRSELQPWETPQLDAPDTPAPELPLRDDKVPMEVVERPIPQPAEEVEITTSVPEMPDLNLQPEPVQIGVPEALAHPSLPTADSAPSLTRQAETPIPTPEIDIHIPQTAPEEVVFDSIPKTNQENSPDKEQHVSTLIEQPFKPDPPEAIDADHTGGSEAIDPLASDLQTEVQTIVANTTQPVSQSAQPSDMAIRPNAVDDVARARPRAKTQFHRQDGRAVPGIYRDRRSQNRMAVIQSRGGGYDTEQAVQAALRWLAENQGIDGRWNASEFGAGQRNQEGGHDRGDAGMNADTGITGLALLAFLGAGHTHLDDDAYGLTLRRGLAFLQQVGQASKDGSLAAKANRYAAMYCHGIATLAISEAYSLSGDGSLRGTLDRAVAHTLRMQHPFTGGWRYQAGEEGDTSQLGWQLMSATSAFYAGVTIPQKTWLGAKRFLDGATIDGRAAYRPGEAPSRTMTAEAMLCRLFLRTSIEDANIQRGADFVLQSLPGAGRDNYYYWYYGTLALYHLQDQRWQRWNDATKRTLMGRQNLDGSWPADSVWGSSGGRIYTTALGALTLEIYYRYRPLAETAPKRRNLQHTARAP